jgi:acetate kinase
MTAAPPCVLTINGGSSSIRFAIYEPGEVLRLGGMIGRIGLKGTSLSVTHPAGKRPVRLPRAAANHGKAGDFLLGWLASQPVFAHVKAVGHRVVQGMSHSEPARVTPKLIADLRRLTSYDPDHLPLEIGLIEAVSRKHPKLPQVACFDTAFHHDMPEVARLLPLPRRYAAKGVRRYGFHGISYTFLMEELDRLDPAAAKGRVILAHLGNGASMAAVHRGKSVDTSMGFTPTSGLVMSTRSGDLDPGLVYFLSRTENMTAKQFQQMVNHDSGLLGVSGSSSDVRDLCASEATDGRAREALDLFCYQARKWIGSFAAVLGGLDTLVFSAGIGENSPLIRNRICDGLGFLGVSINGGRNTNNAPVISPSLGRVKVRVIRTNEELMIARSVARILHLS